MTRKRTLLGLIPSSRDTVRITPKSIPKKNEMIPGMRKSMAVWPQLWKKRVLYAYRLGAMSLKNGLMLSPPSLHWPL